MENIGDEGIGDGYLEEILFGGGGGDNLLLVDGAR